MSLPATCRAREADWLRVNLPLLDRLSPLEALLVSLIDFRCQSGRLAHPGPDGEPWWEVTVDTIAAQLHASGRTVRRALSHLVETGNLLIQEHHVADGSKWRHIRSYRVAWDDDCSANLAASDEAILAGSTRPEMSDCSAKVAASIPIEEVEEQREEQEHARPSGRADGEEADVALLPTPPRTEEPKPSTSRGSRLPEHWAPSPDLARWTVEHLGDPERCRTELATFRDYWIAVPGARGRKVSWEATWRNWVRRAAERGGPAPRAGGNRQETTGDRRRREFAETLAALNGDRS